MAGRNVTPDETLLSHVFGNNQPSSVSIILQDWDKCVVTTTFSSNPKEPQHPCIARLEALNGKPSHFIPPSINATTSPLRSHLQDKQREEHGQVNLLRASEGPVHVRITVEFGKGLEFKLFIPRSKYSQDLYSLYSFARFSPLVNCTTALMALPLLPRSHVRQPGSPHSQRNRRRNHGVHAPLSPAVSVLYASFE